MKKSWLTLLTGALLLVWLCLPALGAASIYIEGSGLTQYDFESTKGTDSESDWASAVSGVDITIGRFKIASESFAGSLDWYDVESEDIRFGFALIDNDSIRLDATLGYHDLEVTTDFFYYDRPETVAECDGLMIGLDLRLDLAERIVLEASAGYSNVGNWENIYGNRDATLLTYKLKCDLMPWKHFGFSVAYRYYSYRPESLYDAENNFFGVYCGLIWHGDFWGGANHGPMEPRDGGRDSGGHRETRP